MHVQLFIQIFTTLLLLPTASVARDTIEYFPAMRQERKPVYSGKSYRTHASNGRRNVFFKMFVIALVTLTSIVFAPATGVHAAPADGYAISTNHPVVRGETFQLIVECNIPNQFIGFEIYRDGIMVFGEYPAVCDASRTFRFDTTFTRAAVYEVRVTIPEVDLEDILNFPGVTVASLTLDLRQKAFIPMVVH